MPSFDAKVKATKDSKGKKGSVVSTLLGNCICNPFSLGESRGLSPSTQIVELSGVRFIGLGALVDELTCRERVFDTLEQLTTRSERLISVGYLLQGKSGRVTETVPLDVWNQNFPNDRNMMCRDVRRLVNQIRSKQFDDVITELSASLASQKSNLERGNNRFMAGITAHNIGVAKVLAGRDSEAEGYFRQAISLKEAAFGQSSHHEIALSWGELGTQLFSRGDFEGARAAFRKAHELDVKDSMRSASRHLNIAVALNNIACCDFQMGDHKAALSALQEARSVHREITGAAAQADRDLLDVATVICNCGYLSLAQKKYEEGLSLLEEGLLIQQSVLDESHRAIRDTRSNIEFAHGFHSVT